MNAATEMMEGKIRQIDQMGTYWVNHGNSLRDYGISQRWSQTPVVDDEIDVTDMPED